MDVRHERERVSSKHFQPMKHQAKRRDGRKGDPHPFHIHCPAPAFVQRGALKESPRCNGARSRLRRAFLRSVCSSAVPNRNGTPHDKAAAHRATRENHSCRALSADVPTSSLDCAPAPCPEARLRECEKRMQSRRFRNFANREARSLRRCSWRPPDRSPPEINRTPAPRGRPLPQWCPWCHIRTGLARDNGEACQVPVRCLHEEPRLSRAAARNARPSFDRKARSDEVLPQAHHRKIATMANRGTNASIESNVAGQTCASLTKFWTTNGRAT